MNAPLLLDTHALIWAASIGSPQSVANPVLEDLLEADRAVHASPISAWEIATLVKKGRLALTMTPRAWWDQAVVGKNIGIAPLSSDVLIASTVLPNLRHYDPADCILVATAREMGFCLVTRDRTILDYARQGHVLALAC